MSQTQLEKHHRVAVLPLANISPNSADAYFADGMTEELISVLSKIAAFRVISRTSVMKYRDSSMSAGEIGKELQVKTLVEGSVRKMEDRVRISIQLVDTQTEERIWSRDYDRLIKDIFSIQGDIARKIASSLKVRIPQHERELIEKKATDVPDAYTLYLNGRYHLTKRTEEGLKSAIKLFEQSLASDPRLAQAHCGLADAYSLLALFEFAPPKQAFPKARSNAEEAISLDPNLAEAHTSLGLVLFQYERSWSGAQEEFQRASFLNPNYAQAHQYYADLLKALGHFDEALTEMREALELDPLSLAINTGIGHVLYLSRQYDRAIEQYMKTLRMDPNFLQAHLWFGRPYLQKGMFKEAIEELKQAVALSSGSTMSLAVLGHAYASAGEKEEALKILEKLLERSKEHYLPSYWIALVYTGLGDKDKAFEWLGRAYDDRSSWLVWMKVEPRFDSLRSDARFDSLLRNMGLTNDISLKKQTREGLLGWLKGEGRQAKASTSKN
jgi:TolB-like protein/Tfp pilus assembly protein PilF